MSPSVFKSFKSNINTLASDVMAPEVHVRQSEETVKIKRMHINAYSLVCAYLAMILSLK